jgi:negative regulator of flagellin synthesis FlgM
MSGTNGIGNSPGVALPVTPVAAPAAAGKEQQVKAAHAPVVSVSRVNHAIDQANISTTSNLISAALSASDVRQEKILPIQQAIANGTYSVSSSDVADKIISSLVR